VNKRVLLSHQLVIRWAHAIVNLAAEPSHLRLRRGAYGACACIELTKFSSGLTHPVPCAAHTSRTAMIFFCNCRSAADLLRCGNQPRCSLPTRAPRPKPRGFVSPAALSPTLLRRATRRAAPGSQVNGLPCRRRHAPRQVLLQPTCAAAAALRAVAAAHQAEGRKFPRPARQERAGRRLWGARAEWIA